VTAKKKLIFTLVTALLTVALLESALQVLSWLSSDVDAVLSARPRARTGSRPHWMPTVAHPEHDTKGFRNPSIPATAPIVALGDSNTYGWGVKAHDAWPRQLERMAGQKVYSLAWGGFGPVHLLALFDDVLALKPRLVIFSFFSGNDLYDSYSFVYKEKQFPLLKNRDPRVISQLELMENDPIQKKRIEELQGSLREFHALTRGQRADPPVRRAQPSAIRRFISDHVKFWGLVRAAHRRLSRERSRSTIPYDYLNHEPTWEAIREQAQKYPDIYWIFDNGRLRTVFTLGQRLYGMNLTDPRILEGQRIAMATLHIMDAKIRAAGGNFLVMRWPTKELAFKDLVYRDTQPVPEGYQTFVENEETVWRQTKEFLTRNNIDHFDVLPEIRESLSMDIQVYGTSQDSHINGRGHRVIADRTLAQLQSIRFQ
jgi:hypothetical protein